MKKITEYLRVTDILYPFSGLKSVDPHILRNAADRGTKIHEICDAIINHMGIIDLDPTFGGYIDSFNEWAEGKEFLDHPGRFYCDTYKITGEVDGFYENENGLTLFDLKTPAKEGKTWSLQGSAYSYLANKANYNVTQIEFVRLCKNGGSPTLYHYKEDFETFLKCFEIYKRFFSKEKQEDLGEYL